MQYRTISIILLVLALLPTFALGEEVSGLEAGANYTHMSSNTNGGGNGFGGTVGYRFGPHVALLGEGDFLWSNSHLSAFGLSNFAHVGGNTQNFLGGGRFYILGWKPAIGKHQLLPYAELLFGLSRTSQNVQTFRGSVSSSDNAFTWVLGGGVDYSLAPKWMARGSLDLVRTHFADAGQSHWRLGLGFAHVF
jgi:opacity protein-like surface antigen